MGNLCSIFHSRFKNLIKIIPSARKAQLMDYILLGWQTSTYTLKNSHKKWFMKPHEEIAEETQIKLSTLKGYLKEFEQAGFIVRRQARYNRQNAQGQYYVTMGGYIHITDKFLQLIQVASSDTPQSSTAPHLERATEHTTEVPQPPSRSFFDNNQLIDSLKTGESFIRDLRTSFNNNIKFKNLLQSVDKPTVQRLMTQFESVHQLFTKEIKEEIPDEVKKLVVGTFFNLTFEHKKLFSNPQQVASEYLFSLINTAYCLPEVRDFKHRNHILAKILRSNHWRTPKGFYKHFYLGAQFKDQHDLRQTRWEEQKAAEIRQAPDVAFAVAQCLNEARLQALEERMQVHSTRLEAYTQALYTAPTEHDVALLREKIRAERQLLEALWAEQAALESEAA